MLSFMNDDESKSRGVKAAQTDNASAGDKAQISSEQDYLVPAEHGKNVKHGTILLIGLSCVGALVVWFMIKKTTPAAATAGPSQEEQQIEQTIAQLTGIKREVSTKVDDIVGRFYHFSDVQQVGVAELKKNPFRHEFTAVGPAEAPVDDSARREEIESRARAMQLWSVMQSPQGNCCMINDKILYVGDTIDGFLVVRIVDKTVELAANGVTVHLKMPE